MRMTFYTIVYFILLLYIINGTQKNKINLITITPLYQLLKHFIRAKYIVGTEVL